MTIDNRRFLRVPISENHRVAVLRYDGRSLACEFLNESAGGYGVAVDPKLADTFPPGKIVVLDVNDLVVKVRIVHARQDEEKFTLGLERIEEIEDRTITRQQQKWTWLSALYCPTGQSSTEQSNVIRNVGILFILAGTMLVWLFMPATGELFGGSNRQRRSERRISVDFSWLWPRASYVPPSTATSETVGEGVPSGGPAPAARTAPASGTSAAPAPKL